MTWIKELDKLQRKKGKSQYGESSIIKFIFQNVLPENKFFVDIGAGFYGGGEMSNTQELIDDGWVGLQIDADNSNNEGIKQLYVTPDNIVPFLRYNNVPYGFDFLSIDIDSFDLNILEAVVPEYKPRVICTEYNGTLDPALSIRLRYEEGYVWDRTNKFGYSFGAGVKFCNKYGYKIIFNHLNQNLFLVRNDVIEYTPVISAKRVNYHPVNKNAVWEDYE